MYARIWKRTLVVGWLLLVFATAFACSDSDTNPADGDAPDGDSDGDLPDGDGDDDPTDGDVDGDVSDGDVSCDFSEPYCEDELVVACVDGVETRTACEGNDYCNYGSCATGTVDFPTDAGFHSERSEWWYYTGHVSDGERQWGFEVTIFQYDMEAIFNIEGDGYMCHVAITDKTAGEHYHVDTIGMSPEVWSNDPIVLEIDNCRFEMSGDGHDHIRGVIPAGKEKDGKASPWELDLAVVPEKRVALHGGDGIIPMSEAGGRSWYYSYTRMTASGTLVTPDGEVAVDGQAWMDHQWGAFDIVEFKGWDWWSMQFADGYEIMLFQFTNWDGELDSQAGTIIDPDGNLTELEGLDAFSITSLRSWESTHTDGIYPLDWDIAIPEMDWAIQVRVGIDDQEMYNVAQNYWEGETTLTATRGETSVTGVGYTELTGYASDTLDPKPE